MTKSHPHEKPHHPHWPLACLLFLFVFAVGLLSVHDSDTWLHVRTGGLILAERALPQVDPYSFTVAGRPWTTDSWLADALFGFVHDHFGPRGLAFLKSAAAATAFALVLPLNPGSPLTCAVVLALGAVSAWPGLVELPSVFDFLLLAALIRLLRPRRFKATMVVQAAVLECLWANLHGATAPLGLWIIALKTFKASLRTEKKERLWHWALLGASVLALGLNPHGFGIMAHAFAGLDAVASSNPASPYLNLYNVFCLVGAYSCTVMLQQEFFLTMTAATVLGLSLLIPELRPLAILACCPVVSLAAGHFLRPQDDDLAGVSRLAGLMGLLLGLHWLGVTLPLAGRGYGSASVEGVVGFLNAHDVRGRMFNEVDGGAALIGNSARQVFVDSREALYGREFISQARRWPSSFQALSDIYGFDYAVVLNRRVEYPARVLDDHDDWRLAYADDTALAYVRRGGIGGRVVAGRPRPLLRPNRLWPDSMDEALRDEKKRARLIAELDAWIAQSPGSAQPLIWKAYALGSSSSGAEPLLRAVQANPAVGRDPELSAALAYVLASQGRPQEARRHYRRARLIARRRGELRLEAEIAARAAAS